MSKKSTRQQIAQDTLSTLERGHYLLPDGTQVDLGASVADCVDRTVFYDPSAVRALGADALLASNPQYQTIIELVAETALEGAKRCYVPGERIGLLNFASAKNPGGGFLGGAQAQEESLARSSALYPSLMAAPQFYHFGRSCGTLLYTDAMIVSPDCPVIRDDNGTYWPAFPVTFITSAAPNRGAMEQHRDTDISQIEATFYRRIPTVLGAAVVHGCETLILGAWGCGVFRNDPMMVAQAFKDLLRPGALWAGYFKRISFSIYDPSRSGEVYRAFEKVLGEVVG
jgi:uncharacterized protein (TIGR02452 family)